MWCIWVQLIKPKSNPNLFFFSPLCTPSGSSLKTAVHMAARLPDLFRPPSLLHLCHWDTLSLVFHFILSFTGLFWLYPVVLSVFWVSCQNTHCFCCSVFDTKTKIQQPCLLGDWTELLVMGQHAFMSSWTSVHMCLISTHRVHMICWPSCCLGSWWRCID